MNIILWIGNEPNQIALAQKIHSSHEINTIFLETKAINRKLTFSLLFQKLIEKVFLTSISKSWFGMLSYYNNLNIESLGVNVVNVDNINSELVYQKTKSLNPDLVIVSGTRLIKERLLSIQPKIGILNLHTGLSPYIKGGPNCTNWCIATEQYHLIGNTIMWIDKGIDSGRIIVNEPTIFSGQESLLNVHIKVMEHGHSLYLKAIDKVINNKVIGVEQNEIALGKIYYTKDWSLIQKIKLILNYKKFIKTLNSKEYLDKQSLLKIIDLK